VADATLRWLSAILRRLRTTYATIHVAGECLSLTCATEVRLADARSELELLRSTSAHR
jgi:hypothetical protein